MTALALALALLVQAPPARVAPVLTFPEPGLDDPAAYRGYRTRFYRDSKRNTVQIYLEPRGGRAVLVWADAANESAGFTVRDPRGRPASLEWDGHDAAVSDSAGFRTIEFGLAAGVPAVTIGWPVLGSGVYAAARRSASGRSTHQRVSVMPSGRRIRSAKNSSRHRPDTTSTSWPMTSIAIE